MGRRRGGTLGARCIDVERLMLLLDSEAVSAVAHGRPVRRRDEIRALVTAMRDRGQPVGVAATTLAEVIRGRPADAGVHSLLNRERVVVHDVDRRIATRAGQLLDAIGEGSELAVDAFLVATGELGGGAVIATTDPDDLDRLAAHAASVVVVDVT